MKKITSLKDSNNFVLIKDRNIYHYGGNQDWFREQGNNFGALSGCGAIVASDITAYMAKQFPDYCSNLYKYDINNITKEEYKMHMKEVYEYVTPGSIFKMPTGITNKEVFADYVIEYANSRGVNLKAKINGENEDCFSASSHIRDGLNKNLPIAILVKENLKYPDYEWHWMVITEFAENATKEMFVKVATWGDDINLKFSDLWEKENGLIYFEIT